MSTSAIESEISPERLLPIYQATRVLYHTKKFSHTHTHIYIYIHDFHTREFVQLATDIEEWRVLKMRS